MEKKYVSNRPDISLKELRKMFPYISADQLAYEVEGNEYATLRGFLSYMGKINDGYKERAERPDVVRLEIEIEWVRSSTWGQNPHATYEAYFADGTYKRGEFRCSGCGYDKESTVVADVYNAVCSGMLWRKRNSRQQVPYGASVRGTWFPHFNGGVGMSCYHGVTEFLGGKLEHVANRKSYDYWLATWPKKK